MNSCHGPGAPSLSRKPHDDICGLQTTLTQILESVLTGAADDRLRAVYWNSPTQLRETLDRVLAEELALASGHEENGLSASLGGNATNGYVYFSPGPQIAQSEDWQVLTPHRTQPTGSIDLNRHIKAGFRQKTLDLLIGRCSLGRFLMSRSSKKPASMVSGYIDRSRQMTLKAMSSIPRRSPCRGDGGAQRRTRSTAKHCSGRCWPGSAGSRVSAKWLCHLHRSKRTTGVSHVNAPTCCEREFSTSIASKGCSLAKESPVMIHCTKIGEPGLTG